MLDDKIAGSYLRDLRWTKDTPGANQRARQELFERTKAHSLFSAPVRTVHADLEVGLCPESDHVLAWYQVHSLDGAWPGGDYVLQSLQFIFDPGTLGGRLDIEMLPAELHGFPAWKRRWGLGFPPGPLVRRFPLLAGEYDFRVKLRGSHRGGSPVEQEVGLGLLTVPEGLSWPGYGAANDLLVRWGRWETYEAGGQAFQPVHAQAGKPVLPGWLEPYFAALDQAIAHVRQWHFCPNTTENWYYRRTPAEGYLWNERYLGFYLSSFLPAYLLTGEPRYLQMVEYLYNTILHNLVPSFWGGVTSAQSGADTGDNLLHMGILARAVLRLAGAFRNPELARPLYDVYAAWPRDPEHGRRFINVVFPDQTEQRRPFVYNQVMSSVAAAWPLGEIFGNADLRDTAERMWTEGMRPGWQEEGYWFYTEDAEVVTQHYDLVMKSDASLWLEYPRWAQEEDFREVMRRSLDFALETYATPVSDMLVWQPFYSGKFETSLALGKAGMALEIMHRLHGAGFDQYDEPARKTARFIERMRAHALDTRDMWQCSWFSCHVIAPLLEAVLAGMVE
jgi:hypothetical protein